MLQFKKQIAFLFGAIAMISYVSVRYFPTETNDVAVISVKDEATHMQVYILDQDHTLVPISIAVDADLSEEDKLQMMIAYMSGKQKIPNFQPLFQEECTLETVEISNGIATLNFDDSFAAYDEQNELRVLEAITWGTTQFHDIEQVRICMNGNVLKTMPKANTPIPDVLNRSIGINHFETSTTSLHNSREITVFCTKRLDGQEYMVPRSRRVMKGNDEVKDTIDQILSDVAVSSQLSQPLYAEDVKIQQFSFEDGVMIVELNRAILDSSQTVKQDIYNALILSLSAISDVSEIQLKVDGVIVSPSEQSDEPVSCYDLSYNEIQF